MSLTLAKLDRLRGQAAEDWFAGLCPSATLADLDPAAIQAAHAAFIARLQATNRSVASETMGWDTATLLDTAKVTIAGRITRTAMLLLGGRRRRRITWRRPSLSSPGSWRGIRKGTTTMRCHSCCQSRRSPSAFAISRRASGRRPPGAGRGRDL